ncbi:PTS ascorbate transporter subunit IIC [Paenibacillus sp. J2TS4]|uniref:PTS ascorbate transporter subunit IIC n=1 Tax=Paenibacillus sp. J2TS4 TaxID=2807194 RepID=UPI001B0DC034|nr:PTS ascorbate transporter subunit IIC [Paenibacillus sp. J2TS4]GIP35097.1 PTS ascorbate transporter subunit IIC [Paenibacillus sp. J2TS4]
MNLSQTINKGLFGEPVILLGLIALIGLLLQRNKVQKVVSGTIKTMLGLTLLQIGAAAAGSSLSNLSAIIQNGFQIIGIIPHNETITALAQINYGQEIAIMMLIGMGVHLAIARFTRFKFVFLTGHHMLFMASLLAAVLAVFPMQNWQQYTLGGMVLALCMSFGPAISQPFVRRTTGDNSFALGHFNSVGYVLTGCLASLFKSRKERPVPAKLQKIQPFFQDNMIVIAIFTFVLFLSASFFASSKSISDIFSGRNFVIVSVIQSIWFTGGVYIILHGVRMMLSEIIPAFQGIAQRLVPGSIPAVDCPVLFTYSPLAAVMGFLLSFTGGLLAMIIMLNVQYTVIIPGIIPHFFSGGASGVIAYKIGGRRGLVVASLCHGFFISLLPIFLLPLLTGLGHVRATFADGDFSVIGIILHYIMDVFFR